MRVLQRNTDVSSVRVESDGDEVILLSKNVAQGRKAIKAFLGVWNDDEALAELLSRDQVDRPQA